MKKIQVTTVPKQANVQVIELCASFIVKAVRAADFADELYKNMLNRCPTTYKTDENGETVTDSEGRPIIEEYRWKDSCIRLDGHDAEQLVNNVIPFLVELRNAMLDD